MRMTGLEGEMRPLDTATPGGERWQRLAARLLSVLSQEVPGWTDQPMSDPGIALAELFAFLGEQLTFDANAIPEPTRTRLFGVAAKLDSLRGGGDGATVRVSVDGEEWRRVNALADAGPHDRVFILTDDGRVVFGDGTHGSVPAPGGQVFASYRLGAGDVGNARVSITTRWPPTATRCRVALDPEPGIHFSAGERSTAARSGT